MIGLIVIFSLFTRPAEYQLPLYSVCEDKCYAVDGYIAITADHIYIHINSENTTYTIKGKVTACGKVFYRIKSGWFIYTVNGGVMEQDGEVTRFRFKNKFILKNGN
jgi:hypothetical protein